MKKKRLNLLIAFAVCALVQPYTVSAWSRLGHLTVAQIAYDHLDPQAKKVLLEKMDGVTLMSVASDADAYRAYWTTDIGFVPENLSQVRPRKAAYLNGFDHSQPGNIVPYPHCITVDADGKAYRDIRVGNKYIFNAAWYVCRLAEELKSGKLDEEQTKRAIALITHFLGDMHCPVHIYYDAEKSQIGHFKVNYKGDVMKFHSFWDKEVPGIYSNSGKDLSAMADVCTAEEVRELTEGDVYDWAEDSAASCHKAVTELIPSSPDEVVEVSKLYPREYRGLLFSQLRKAGYRLAAIFNEIFGCEPK